MNGAFEKLAQAGNYWHKQRLISSLSQGTAILTSPKCHKTNSANCGRRSCSGAVPLPNGPYHATQGSLNGRTEDRVKPSWSSASSMLVSSIGLFNGLPIFTFPPNMPPEERAGWHMRSVLTQGPDSTGTDQRFWYEWKM